MKKNNIKLALLLALGIGFQAQAMNDNMNLLTDEEMVNEIIEILEQKEKDQQEEKRIKKEKEEEERQKQPAVQLKKILSELHCKNGGYCFRLLPTEEKQLTELLNNAVIPQNTLEYDDNLLKPEHGIDVTEALINCGANVDAEAQWTGYPLLYTAGDKFYGDKADKDIRLSIKDYIKLLLGHNAVLKDYTYTNFNQKTALKEFCDIVTEVDTISNGDSLEKIIEKHLNTNDVEAWVFQRMLMKINSSKELRNFLEKFKKITEKILYQSFKNSDIQNTLFETYVTPAIMYQFMIKGIVPLTEEHITAQPSKGRREALRNNSIFFQNKMSKFNDLFDLNLKLLHK